MPESEKLPSNVARERRTKPQGNKAKGLSLKGRRNGEEGGIDALKSEQGETSREGL